MQQKTIITLATFLSLIGSLGSISAEPVCHKCEVIREANKHKVNKYTYYDDYLKDNPNEAKAQGKSSDSDSDSDTNKEDTE